MFFRCTLCAASLLLTGACLSGEPPAAPAPALADQLGVMLQLDNLLPDSHRWGNRAPEVERQFELLEEAGVRWTRVGILWEQIEAAPGRWDWDAADHVVHTARRHHVQMVWLVGGTALWDSTNGDWNGTPKDLNDPNGHWPQFVHRLVERYRQDIAWWEIRNEPNLDQMSHEQYAEYLTQAARVIRRVDPHAHILFGGLGGDLPQQIKWFKNVVKILRARGGPLPFDAANFHVYGNLSEGADFKGKGSVARYLDACIQKLDALMREERFDDLPLWITEFDYPAEAKHQSPDPDLHRGEESQAEYARTLFPHLVEGRPERKVFWASLLDDYNSGGEFKSTGLIASDQEHHILKRREAYGVVKRLLRPAEERRDRGH